MRVNWRAGSTLQPRKVIAPYVLGGMPLRFPCLLLFALEQGCLFLNFIIVMWAIHTVLLLPTTFSVVWRRNRLNHAIPVLQRSISVHDVSLVRRPRDSAAIFRAVELSNALSDTRAASPAARSSRARERPRVFLVDLLLGRQDCRSDGAR